MTYTLSGASIFKLPITSTAIPLFKKKKQKTKTKTKTLPDTKKDYVTYKLASVS